MRPMFHRQENWRLDPGRVKLGHARSEILGAQVEAKKASGVHKFGVQERSLGAYILKLSASGWTESHGTKQYQPK